MVQVSTKINGGVMMMSVLANYRVRIDDFQLPGHDLIRLELVRNTIRRSLALPSFTKDLFQDDQV